MQQTVCKSSEVAHSSLGGRWAKGASLLYLPLRSNTKAQINIFPPLTFNSL